MTLRRFLVALVAIAGSIGAVILLLEAVLSRFPVREPMNPQPVNAQHPYIHSEPNRVHRFSRGWNFAIQSMKRINNFGYPSDDDFDPKSDVPLLAVVGDSYVEALQVENREALPSVLHARVAPRGGRVYGLGFSGAALAQYLAYAKFFGAVFRPRAMVFVVVGNDFDESLLKYKKVPGFHYLREAASGQLELLRVDRGSRSAIESVVARSNLARYLFGTVGIGDVWLTVRSWAGLTPRRVWAGNAPFAVDSQRYRDSLAAIDYFLAHAAQFAQLTPRQVLLVVDGIRPHPYSARDSAAVANSYFASMRKLILARAAQLGYETVDLESVFANQFRIDGRRFEFQTDAHWNAHGHKIVADAIASTKVFREFVGD